jgi:heme exporter protein CcmD
MLEWLPVFDKNAAYVWAAYALSFGVVAALVVIVSVRARLARVRLARLQRAAGENAEPEARS